MHNLLVFRNFSTAAKAVSKDLLMKIRKSTGYSFLNCKKALEMFGEDLENAEKWLHNEARKAGWSRMASNRTVANGLVGVYVEQERSLMLELNCETDFVSRNDKFRRLSAQLCKDLLRSDSVTSVVDDGARNSHKWNMPLDKVEAVKPSSGDDISGSVKDLIAFYSGQLGEKIAFTRAVVLKAQPNSVLFGYVHPKSPPFDGAFLGQFGAVVNFAKENSSPELQQQRADFDLDQFGGMLCQHIVGMKPDCVGAAFSETEIADRQQQSVIVKEKQKKVVAEGAGDDEVEEEDEPIDVTTLGNEKELLKQDFLLNPDIKVADVLKTNNVRVFDFVRFERGETSNV